MRPIATRAALLVLLMAVTFDDGVARDVDMNVGPKATRAWTSRDDCERAAPLPRDDGEARIASWNIRWFPDGDEANELSPDEHTDVEWLACAIAHLNVDVIAVQEFKKHARARERASRLLSLLDDRTNGSWDLVLDDCPDENQPHVGFVYDSSRIQGSHFWQIDHLNPFPDRCGGAANAGFAGTF
ncbi:MAG TPA: hypothetical protein VFB62_15140, partial [Polyangiaceae bacterium]|nr:hypothetical protein [Polyangiaceae bacterium]